jgi:SAM-dependent methyltransferase
MKECSKSISRRLSDARFATRYFVGDGLDIGGKPDPLALYLELFPRAISIRTWDWEDGDAQVLAGVPDGSYDFVHSSHCLEHLVDPAAGLAAWFRVLRPGGHLVVTVPDEDLYEQGVFPSTYNRDHKHTFTIAKRESWSAVSINLLAMLGNLAPDAQLLKLELLDMTYRFALPRYDQTATPVGESAIEFVVRKRLPEELARKGRLPGDAQPDTLTRIHLNQYRDDRATVIRANPDAPPFNNDNPL